MLFSVITFGDFCLMNKEADLSWRRLEGRDLELAGELARQWDRDDPEEEAFGAAPPMPGPEIQVWGLWIRGGLSGVAWLRIAGASATVVTLVLARGWRRMGLLPWMLEQLAAAARANGAREMGFVVASGSERLGRECELAGFHGPDAAAAEYPVGEWRKKWA